MKNLEYQSMSCIGIKERQFLKDLLELSNYKLDQKYSANYRRVLKYRILRKRRSLTDDLLLINAVLDKLQSL
jgi:hypothetical protein